MRKLMVVLAVISFILPLIPKNALGQGDNITVTIIYDNYAVDDRFETDWGFAALIETGDETVLFDAGTNGEMFMRNFRALGKDPMEIDALVFSHDHGDHTGGMDALFATGVRPPTYLLGAFSAELHNRVAAVTDAIDTEPGDEILAGIFTTGRVGAEIPEQALAIPTADGLVVITGCAHPGVVAMLERVRELNGEPVHLVFGGFHLFNSSAEHVASTIATVRSMGIEKVGATHCTGDEAIAAFREEWGDEFVELGVGRVLTFRARGSR